MTCEAVKPTKEHEWLQQLVGEWTFEAEANMCPDDSPMKTKGRETVRSLGGLWVVGEGEGEMPGGGEAQMLLTVGFDPATGSFIGTWVGSMMTNMFVYKGSLDETGKVLALQTQGPSMMNPGTTATYRDVIELVSKDERLLRSEMLGDDGRWHEFMKARYRRVGR